MPIKQNIKTSFCSTISVLLSFVIVLNLSFSAFHVQTEEHYHSSEQNCSVDDEMDACHRFLIHHEKSTGCNGSHQHVTNTSKICFACNFLKNQQQSLEPSIILGLLQQTKFKPILQEEPHFKFSHFIYVFLRGPPALS